MKRTKITTSPFLTLLCLLLLSQWGHAKRSPIIKVEKVTIYQEQVDSMVTIYQSQSRAQNKKELAPAKKQQLKKMIAASIVGKELLLLEIKAKKITVSPNTVDSALAVFKQQLGNPNAYQAMLKNMGSSEAKIKLKLREQLLMEKLVQSKLSKVQRPTDKELKAAYTKLKSKLPKDKKMRASQIVLKVSKKASKTLLTEKTKKLNDLRAKLSKIEHLDQLVQSFMQAAYQFSETEQAKVGGDIGQFSKGDFFPGFDKAISKLKVGQMSKVFRSDMGVHLVLLIGKNDGQYENYKALLFQEVVSQKTQKQQKDLKAYMQTLLKKYKIAYLDPSYKGLEGSNMNMGPMRKK